MSNVWYEVVEVADNHVRATTGCMDNALDVIETLENFDRAEGFFSPDRYIVRIVKVKADKK